MHLRQMLEETVDQYGEKDAIVINDRRISYSELDKASNKIANTLIKLGVNKGDRVAFLLSNSPEFVITYFGTVKIGAIAVPLDIKYKADDLTPLLNNALPKILVIESVDQEPLLPVLSGFKSIDHIIDIDSRYEERYLSYQEIIAEGSEQPIEIELDSDDIANINYTSGSSFNPKGVMLSHHSLVSEAVISANGFQQTYRDKMMLYALPMHHVLGLAVALLGSIYTGSTVVMVPGTGLSISSFMAAIERERGTIFVGVPFIFAIAADMAEREGIKSDLSSLRLCICAGAPLSIDIMERFKKQFGFNILDCWGLTEAVCHVTCPSLNGNGRSGSVGKALPGWEVKIIGNDGKELLPNQSGEMVVRGPITNGYYNNQSATAAVIKNGWLHSGDVGKADEEGNLYITGRLKDTIIVKGQNISPGDIEAVLIKNPKVAEVAVIGIWDELRGEVIGAIISLKEGEVATEHEIKQFCLERIVSYKAPKQVFFMESLPRTATGQIDKESIRNQLSIPFAFPPVK
ncbi:class I adenylate-forming enzyme family protein [Chloroflexota bacterium]